MIKKPCNSGFADKHPPPFLTESVSELCHLTVLPSCPEETESVVASPESGGEKAMGPCPASPHQLHHFGHITALESSSPKKLGWGARGILYETILHCTGLSVCGRTFSIRDSITTSWRCPHTTEDHWRRLS